MIHPDFKKQFDELKGEPYGNLVGGATKWLGGRITEVDEENVAVAFSVRPEMLNPTGAMHGGMISLILDEVMGFRVFLMGRPDIFVAINISVDFVRKAVEGDELTAHPEIIRSGRKMVNACCKLVNQDGKIVATATSNFTKIT